MKYLRFLSISIIFLVTACGGAPAPAAAPAPQQPPAAQEPTVVVVVVTQESAPDSAALAFVEAPTADEAPNTTGCSNSARLEDENPPFGAKVKAGQDFKKTWTLTNTGTCTWDSSYRLVFVSGEQMAALSQVQPLVKNTIPPGSSLTVYITMRAPAESGQYTGNWRWVTGSSDNVVSVDVGNGSLTDAISVAITVP